MINECCFRWMKRISFFILSVFTFLPIFAPALFSSDVGKIWKSEKKTWIDPEFGYEITQWTDGEKPSWHLYFNIESFIDSAHAIIFSDRTGSSNLFKLNLTSGEMIQMTDEKNLSHKVWHWPQFKKIWVFTKGGTFKEIDTQNLKCRIIKKIDGGITSFTVTCDGRYIIFARDVGELEISKKNRIGLGPFAVFRLEIATGEIEQISPEYGFKISHLLANPVDPTIVSYCWQHFYRQGDYPGIRGSTPIRIWWLKVDGSDGGPVVPQEFGIHRTHEFWLADGSKLGFCARYKFGDKEGEQFLGIADLNGRTILISAPVSHGHSFLFKDNKHWVVDIYGEDVLTMVKLDDWKIVQVKKLFRHGSSWDGQNSHPHPHFSPDGKYIIFSSDRTGVANVYTVKVNINENK